MNLFLGRQNNGTHLTGRGKATNRDSYETKTNFEKLNKSDQKNR